MDIVKARDYFLLGALKSATVRAPNILHPEGWTVEFEVIRGDASPVLETIRGEVRTFRNIDTAARNLKDIGFNQFCVIND